MPIEIDIVGPSCVAVKFEHVLNAALSLSLSSALTSSDWVTFLLVLLVKTSQHVKLRFPASLARKQRDVVLTRCRNSQRARRNRKQHMTLSAVTDKEGNLLENENESGRKL